jgi:GTP pyrophosphokinase
MAWLRQLLDWQKEAAEPGEFLDSLRYDLHSTEVFVFTPKGDVLSLPAGATPVDFAYAVHTEVGHRCIGRRVNGPPGAARVHAGQRRRRRDLHQQGRQRPPLAGLAAVRPQPRAKNKIKQWFAKERREDAVEAGKEALTRAIRKQGLPLQRVLAGEALPTIVKDLHLTDVTALYVEVGEGRLSAQTVVQKVMTALGGSEGAVEDLAETAVPTRPARGRAPAATPASSSRACPTSG